MVDQILAHRIERVRTMQLSLVQPDLVWEDPEANFGTVRRLLEASSHAKGGLIVLPEMFAVGFSMNVQEIAEEEGGPTERFLHEIADTYDACVVGGVVHRRPSGKGSNDAVVAAPGGEILARYSKLHPFSYAGETLHYEPGREVVIFDWKDVRAAPFVCYDLRFPEVYRRACVRGAEVLITIANFPTARVDHWISLMVARAIENQAFAVGVNRCGADPNVEYPGRSLVVDPRGRILAEADSGEEVLSVEISPTELRSYRSSFPFLKDIRNDFVPADRRDLT